MTSIITSKDFSKEFAKHGLELAYDLTATQRINQKALDQLKKIKTKKYSDGYINTNSPINYTTFLKKVEKKASKSKELIFFLSFQTFTLATQRHVSDTTTLETLARNYKFFEILKILEDAKNESFSSSDTDSQEPSIPTAVQTHSVNSSSSSSQKVVNTPLLVVPKEIHEIFSQILKERLALRAISHFMADYKKSTSNASSFHSSFPQSSTNQNTCKKVSLWLFAIVLFAVLGLILALAGFSN